MDDLKTLWDRCVEEAARSRAVFDYFSGDATTWPQAEQTLRAMGFSSTTIASARALAFRLGE